MTSDLTGDAFMHDDTPFRIVLNRYDAERCIERGWIPPEDVIVSPPISST